MNPLVSIVCEAFNQENYILDCINGFLNQKTDFEYEILFHDDASSDNTANIAQDLERSHPSLFKAIYQRENQYSKGVAIWTDIQFPRAKGKYIAFCEGDDYWTSPLKLQQQVDYLETHPEVGMVYGQVRNLNQTTGVLSDVFGGPNTEFEDLFFCSTIPTVTVMVRTDLVLRYSNQIAQARSSWSMGDYPMWLWFALNSKIAFLPGVTAVYRVLPESASHSRSLARQYAFRLKSNPVSEYFIEHYGHRMTPEFIHRARTHRHRLTLPMALQMRDWEQVAKIRQYFAAAAAQGHDTPADLARMLAHPHLWRHLINLRTLASKIKSTLLHR